MAQGDQAHTTHGGLVAGYHCTRRLAYMLLLLYERLRQITIELLGALGTLIKRGDPQSSVGPKAVS